MTANSTKSIKSMVIMTKVSIIIPVYNVEPFLSRCLDSVLSAIDFAIRNNPSLHAEIICINDGSTDGSLCILHQYEPRVRVVSQENQGLAAARNKGLDLAAGDYIMFVDSDDMITPEAIMIFSEVAHESGAAIVVSSSFLKNLPPVPKPIDCAWKWQTPALEKMINSRHLRSSAVNKFYRTNVLRNVRFINGIAFEDWPFLIDVFSKVDSFALIKASLYVYNTDAGHASITRSKFGIWKVNGYLSGIRHVMDSYADTQQFPTVCRRAGIAAGMMISKVWKCPDCDERRQLVSKIAPVMLYYSPWLKRFLSMKTRYRWWRLSR